MYNELVDSDDPSFAPSIAWQWIEQANECLPEFTELLKKQKWKELSEKGHYLKGSAAFVGADKAKNICEEIQLWERLRRPSETPDVFLRERIAKLPAVIADYTKALQGLTGQSG